MLNKDVRFLAMLAAIGTTSCSGGDGGGQNSCQRLMQRLVECGLFTDGVSCTGTQDPEIEPWWPCVNDCLVATSCADLETMICQLDYGPLAHCHRICPPGATFTCDNGTTIYPNPRCDGFPDCCDNSDEIGCSTFACGSGETIVDGLRCDGFDNCRDRSDEEGCAERICAIDPFPGAQAHFKITFPIDPNHRLVQLAETLDWTEMEERAEGIRQKQL